METLTALREQLHDLLKSFRDDRKFEMLLDVAGVDYLGKEPVRFEVVYHLYSLTDNRRFRVKVKVPEDDARLPSVTDLWASADWCERECFDMFGIKFDGHPHLKRLLMYEGFEGHPLRKDYPIALRQKIPTPEESL